MAMRGIEQVVTALNGDGGDLLEDVGRGGELIRSCSMVAGMHPDQATGMITP